MPDSASDAPPAEDWYASAFGDLYPVLYAHRSVDAAAPEAAFAAGILELVEQDRVLDLCCGAGRHMVHLLKRTLNVTGFDYSAPLLRRAQELLQDRASLVRGDMRRLPFVNQFDAVTNFFTSFGYFHRDDENAQVIEQLAQALRPGGLLCMDYLNPDYVRANLEPESERQAAEYTVREKRWIDVENNRVNKQTAVWKGAVHMTQLEESVRMYNADEMTRMYNAAGLEVQAIYGNHHGEALAMSRPRMILLAKKVS